MAVSALWQSVVHAIDPVVISSCPMVSFTHFSFLPLKPWLDTLSSFEMALRMAFSTCTSHSSTGPSMMTLSTKGADSPSGEFIRLAS